MNGMRKMLGFFMAMAVAAFTASANADNKNFSIQVPASVPPSTFDVTFTNSATGNSSFNSLELIVASGNLTISDAVIKNTTTHASPLSATRAVFTNLSPVKTGKSITITVTAAVTTTGCTPTQVTWDAKAYTGSPSSPSSVFALIPAPSATTINPGCTLGFVKQPAGAAAGGIITSVPSEPAGAPVQVALFQGATQTTYLTGGVSLAIKSGTGTAGATLSGGSATASGGVASFPSLSIDKVGTNYVLTASAGSFTPVDSNPFTIFGGVLGCTNDTNFATGNVLNDSTVYDPLLDTAFIGTPGWGLRRGPNTDGADCIKVDFTFTLDADNHIASLIYDKSAGPPPQNHASFEYVIVWPKVSVDADGWAGKQPLLSWGTTNPPVFPGDYAPGLACVTDVLGDLSAVMPVIPDAAPYNTYPPTSQYYKGKAAKMCVAQQGWTPVGGGFVQYWTKVIDQADGWVGLP